jgi:hypothetical protein
MRETRSMSLRRSSSVYCDQPTCYYFLTQCWIEPQDGFVDTNCPELEFLNGCTYKQIVDKVSFQLFFFFFIHLNLRIVLQVCLSNQTKF